MLFQPEYVTSDGEPIPLPMTVCIDNPDGTVLICHEYTTVSDLSDGFTIPNWRDGVNYRLRFDIRGYYTESVFARRDYASTYSKVIRFLRTSPEPTETPTPEPTETPTPQPTETPTPEPTETPTPAPTETPTPEPTETPTSQPTETPTPEPTATPIPEPTATLTPVPTETPTPEPTETPTSQPTETPTPEPTATPRPEPTNTPTPQPTETPTPEPTSTPTPEPTETSTPQPTETPTPEPTETPTPQPTETPTPEPTETPTPEPTETPTPQPTSTPTPEPTETPTPQPTETPTPESTETPPPVQPQTTTLEIPVATSDGGAFPPGAQFCITGVGTSECQPLFPELAVWVSISPVSAGEVTVTLSELAAGTYHVSLVNMQPYADIVMPLSVNPLASGLTMEPLRVPLADNAAATPVLTEQPPTPILVDQPPLRTPTPDASTIEPTAVWGDHTDDPAPDPTEKGGRAGTGDSERRVHQGDGTGGSGPPPVVTTLPSTGQHADRDAYGPVANAFALLAGALCCIGIALWHTRRINT